MAAQSRFAPATQDYAGKGLSLDALFVVNPPATFFLNVETDELVDIGIYPGSTIVVDRSLAPKAKSSDIVIAVYDNKFVIQRLYKRGKVVRLYSENKEKAYPPIEFKEGQELVIWGVVRNGVNIYY